MHPLSNRVQSILSAQRAGRATVLLTPSQGGNQKRRQSLLKLLVREGYLDAVVPFSLKEPKVQDLKIQRPTGLSSKELAISKNTIKEPKGRRLHLKYGPNGEPAIRRRFCVSKPSRSVHLSSNSFWKPQSGTGIFILSTTRGLLTDREARQHNVGGEVLRGVR